jgi:hypothetical protein
VDERARSWLGRWRWVLVGTAIVALVAAATTTALILGGRSSTRKTSGSPPVGSGYLAATAGWDVFIQWQVTGDAVTGTAHEVAVTGTAPNASTTSSTASVTGKIQGSSISLSFNGGNRHFGTFSGSSFTIDAPRPDGTLAPLTFRQATAQHYNKVVSALQTKLAALNHQAEIRLTRSSHEAAINEDALAVTHDLVVLSSDESKLTAATSPLSGTLGKERADLLTVQGLASDAEEHPTYTTCRPATTAERAATTVEDAANAIGSASDTVSSVISTVRNDITTLKSAFAALVSAEAAMPTYGINLPSKAAVTAAIAQGKQHVASAVSATNAVIAQANAYDNTAWHSANAALEAEHCGGAPTPAQISPLT